MRGFCEIDVLENPTGESNGCETEFAAGAAAVVEDDFGNGLVEAGGDVGQGLVRAKISDERTPTWELRQIVSR